MASQFGEFTASELYCPKCARAQRVRQRLLLYLPDGMLYEYLCSGCGNSLGERKVTGPALATPTTPPPARRRPAPPPSPPPRKPRGLLGG
jgi:hypothetical protein